MTDDVSPLFCDADRIAHTQDAVASANRLLDRARRAEWSANFRAMFARLAALAPLMWLHNKRGSLYALVGVGTVQASTPIKEGDSVTIYIGQDGRLHVRATGEFEDGRFAFVCGPGQSQEASRPSDFTDMRAEMARGRTG